MKKNSKSRLALNIGLLALIVFLIIFFVENSLRDIFDELKSTSLLILFMIIVFGVCYQLIEGIAISRIVKPFAKDFNHWDGFFASCYVAFYRVITLGTGTFISEVQFYRNKGLKASQGIGVNFLHMIMYKLAIITYASVGLVIQFSMFYENAPRMIRFIIAGLVLNLLIVGVLLVLSSSIYLQVGLVVICDKLFKSPKIRAFVDKCNLQIYSLRDAVRSLLEDRTALLKIYGWNLLKLAFWFIIPYVILVGEHGNLDLLQALSFISFSTVLAGVIPTPAGMGSLEFVYILMFSQIIGTVDAASSVLLYRFATYVLPFLIGGVYVFVQKRRKIKEEFVEVQKEKPAND